MAEVGAAGDQGQVKQEVDELAKQVEAIVVDEVLYTLNMLSKKKSNIEKRRKTVPTQSSSTIPRNNRQNQVVQYPTRLWFHRT